MDANPHVKCTLHIYTLPPNTLVIAQESQRVKKRPARLEFIHIIIGPGSSRPFLAWVEFGFGQTRPIRTPNHRAIHSQAAKRG